mmetsp:Transcript_16567/g.39392  ORF Transcript_16567/g.39392 Transcript_16567/m.39392 type:complete len:236 (-) Transcript_16567:167-874(-)
MALPPVADTCHPPAPATHRKNKWLSPDISARNTTSLEPLSAIRAGSCHVTQLAASLRAIAASPASSAYTPSGSSRRWTAAMLAAARAEPTAACAAVGGSRVAQPPRRELRAGTSHWRSSISRMRASPPSSPAASAALAARSSAGERRSSSGPSEAKKTRLHASIASPELVSGSFGAVSADVGVWSANTRTFANARESTADARSAGALISAAAGPSAANKLSTKTPSGASQRCFRR